MTNFPLRVLPAALLAVTVFSGTPAGGMVVEGFSTERHSRFVSGYESGTFNPVPNTSANFLGANYDLSGIPWRPANRRASYVFLSRKHYLIAKHFPGDGSLQYFSPTSGVQSATRLGSVDVTESDIRIGRLATLIPAAHQIATYPLLNLPTANDYIGEELFMVGWWARVGLSKVKTVPASRVVNGVTYKYLFEHEAPAGRADYVRLEGEDSGSPSFVQIRGELALMGNHFYIISNSGVYDGGGDNFICLPEVVAQMNPVLAEDGFALRFLTRPGNDWTGNRNSTWDGGTRLNNNWTSGQPVSTQVVGFDGGRTNKTISLNGDRSVRGIRFTGTAGQTGYTFQSGSTLTTGYVGIRNDAAATQTFFCSVALGSSQHWVAAEGAMHFEGAVNLAGHVLATGGAFPVVLGGSVSGSGSLSVQDGHTVLSGAGSHSGPTYLYGGQLEVAGAGLLPVAAPVVFGGGELKATSSNLSTGPLRLPDSSSIRFNGTPSSIHFAASNGEIWAAGRILDVHAFDPSLHTISIGTDFNGLTPAQRAAIRINGQSVIHAGAGSLKPATPFQLWALQHYPEQAGNPETEADLWGAEAEPAGDSVKNLMRFALGLTPSQPALPAAPDVETDAGGRLVLTVVRNPDALSLQWIVEVSGDLVEWNSGPGHTETLTDEPGLLVVRDVSTGASARFIRLRVTE